jgi:hypothetical protein
MRSGVLGVRGALQSLRYYCSARDVTTSGRPLQVNGSFRVSVPLKYHPYCLDHPTMPLAISSAVWFSLNGVRWSQFSFQSNPLFELRLLIEFCPTIPSRPTAVRWLLSWALFPYSTSRIEGPLAAGSAHPLRSAFRVWLPS